LLISSYVHVEIDGPKVDHVVKLPRSVVWDGSIVRIMNNEDKLESRQIDVLYQARNYVLVSSGVNPGDRVITTDLAAAVEGMPLRLRDDTSVAEKTEQPSDGESGATP